MAGPKTGNPVLMRILHNLSISLLLCFQIQSETICGKGTVERRCKVTTDEGNDVTHVDCTDTGLKCIPLVPNNTVSLQLSNNKIEEASFTDDCFRMLEQLNLSFNALERIQSDSFKVLGNLKELSLSNNLLHELDSYPNDAFVSLTSLLLLDIHGNCRMNIGARCEYPDEALRVLESLQSLTLDGYADRSLGPGFRDLKNLTKLNFTGNCLIEKFSIDIFENLNKNAITTFALDHCYIESLERGVFANFPELKYLRIARTKRLCSEGLINVTSGLNQTNIETLILELICNDVLIEYPAETFVGLKGSRLKNLIWINNSAYAIKNQAIFNLPNETLTYLKFREVYMKGFRNMLLLSLVRLGNLQIVDFSIEGQTFLPEPWDFIQSHAEEGFMSSQLCKTFNCTFYLPKRVREIFFRNINYNFHPEKITVKFSPENSLEHLDVSGGSTDRLKATVMGFNKLKYLNASRSHHFALTDDYVRYVPNLTVLDLSFNNLGIWLNKPGVGHFRHQQLEELHLCGNQIKALPSDFLGNQSRLKELHLYSNHLQTIDFRLNQLASLKFLNLGKNQIRSLTSENMADLDEAAAGRSDVALSLVDNSLLCTCDQQDFVRWFSKTKVKFYKLARTNCTYLNDSIISLRHHRVISYQLETECIVVFVTTGCVFGAIVLLLVLSIFAVGYNRRWQLRYLYYVGKPRINPYQPLDQNQDEDETISKSDAYISYDEHFVMTDGTTLREFITQTILPELSSRGYHIQIRESLPPGPLHISIGNAIRNSGRVIALLSPDYCDDFYNTYEFNMAAIQGLYTRKQLILPIQMSDFIYADDVSDDVFKYLTGAKLYRFPVGTEARYLLDFLERHLKWHDHMC